MLPIDWGRTDMTWATLWANVASRQSMWNRYSGLINSLMADRSLISGQSNSGQLTGSNTYEFPFCIPCPHFSIKMILFQEKNLLCGFVVYMLITMIIANKLSPTIFKLTSNFFFWCATIAMIFFICVLCFSFGDRDAT
jgi:hypothetical protein